MEQAPYGVQTQNYPKGGLLDSMCGAAPGALGSEPQFPLFPKARLSTVRVTCCAVGQDFAGSSLNPLASGSGKKHLGVASLSTWPSV